MTYEQHLAGCRPTSLAHYLKALAVLRLVAEQVPEARARGFWQDDVFVLRSTLTRAELEAFFLEAYRPTPLVAPWNGGSGFFPKDKKDGIEALRGSSVDRLGPYRQAITVAEKCLDRLGLKEKPAKDEKIRLLELCRGSFADGALAWLDAALVLLDDGARYPPLLGTGGNDGRLEFSNNFMQRLLDVIDPRTGGPTLGSAPLLRAALFGEAFDGQRSSVIGQFLPGDAGGANAGTGFEGSASVSSWDFVLMLEGALTFAAAAVRRMPQDLRGALAFPFTVRTSGVGYASAAAADEADSRAEIWLPLWSSPASYAAIRALFAEGRAQVGGRPARNGVDFARAVATLGVDRGLDEFARFAFLVRNGLAYFATPLGRLKVRERPRARLLDPLDGWLDRLRRSAGPSSTAPASVKRAQRRLDTAILALCESGDRASVDGVFVALGACERALAASLSWTLDARLDPLPALSPSWLRAVDDRSPELRLAAALASVYSVVQRSDGKTAYQALRCQVEPVTTVPIQGGGLRARWHPEAGRDVAWTEGPLAQALAAVFRRRLRVASGGRQGAAAGYADRGRLVAELGDVARFVTGDVDDGRLADLLWACLLVDWPRVEGQPLERGRERRQPPAVFALLKLCFAGHPVGDVEPPCVPQIARLAAAGDAVRSSARAARRLRASGLPPAVEALTAPAEQTRRAAAALLFPLGKHAVRRLADQILRPAEAAEPPQLTIEETVP